MKIAVVGGGPAGTTCATFLSEAGAEVLLFDHRGAWEKPCGGGITSKVVQRYPLLQTCLEPKLQIQELQLISPREARVSLELHDPLLIYSRQVLNKVLLEQAKRAGAVYLSERVMGFERRHSGWELRTNRDRHTVDFLVGADGVNSFVRKSLSERFEAEDLMMTYGYRLPAKGPPAIVVKFFPKFSGYLWTFPRTDSLSLGICGRLSQHPTRVLKRFLTDFIANSPWLRSRPPGLKAGGSMEISASRGGSELHPSLPATAELYSALIPSLRPDRLRRNRACGPGWALIGDAAGFVDPITCEGIYYALRSGELLARSLALSPSGDYQEACRQDFLEDFICAAEFFEKFYSGNLLGSDFITRMVQSSARSQTLREVAEAFVAGRQDYRTLRKTLLHKSPRALWQIMAASPH